MSRITQRVPLLVGASFLLTGAMLSGAATAYASSYSDGTLLPLLANETGLLGCSTTQCDDTKECDTNCRCNDSVGCVD